MSNFDRVLLRCAWISTTQPSHTLFCALLQKLIIDFTFSYLVLRSTTLPDQQCLQTQICYTNFLIPCSVLRQLFNLSTTLTDFTFSYPVLLADRNMVKHCFIPSLILDRNQCMHPICFCGHISSSTEVGYLSLRFQKVSTRNVKNYQYPFLFRSIES